MYIEVKTKTGWFVFPNATMVGYSEDTQKLMVETPKALHVFEDVPPDVGEKIWDYIMPHSAIRVDLLQRFVSRIGGY